MMSSGSPRDRSERFKLGTVWNQVNRTLTQLPPRALNQHAMISELWRFMCMSVYRFVFWRWVVIFAIYIVTLRIERGQGTSAGYGITDGNCVSPPGNPTKGKDLEEDRRDVGETN